MNAIVREQVMHMEWADARLWDAVLKAPPAFQSDTRARELLHHVHLVQQLYLQIWREEAPSVSQVAEFEDVQSLYAWVRRYYEPAKQYLASLSEEALQGPIKFPWMDRLVARFGVVHPASIEEGVVQIVLHTAHHRAQLCTRLRDLGGEPPLVDFIAWAWEGKQAASWPQLERV